jgi:hypothetical protein
MTQDVAEEQARNTASQEADLKRDLLPDRLHRRRF